MCKSWAFNAQNYMMPVLFQLCLLYLCNGFNSKGRDRGKALNAEMNTKMASKAEILPKSLNMLRWYTP